jgi:hypothetical protein
MELFLRGKGALEKAVLTEYFRLVHTAIPNADGWTVRSIKFSPGHVGNELNNRSYCQRNDHRPYAHCAA